MNNELSIWSTLKHSPRELVTVPNFISVFRVALMGFGFWYFVLTHNALNFLYITIAVIVLDGIDGIVARKLNQATALGAKLDIYCDRIVELGYWYFFVFIDYLDPWVFWFFLIRGLVVDYLSRKQAKPLGDSFLRSSRFMRGLYGALKLLSFGMLIMVPNFGLGNINITMLLVYLTVLVCFLRALPVLIQYNKANS